MGLLQFVGNAQLEQERQQPPAAPLNVSSLSGYLLKAWSAAREAKRPIEQKMQAMMRQRNGEYDPLKLQQIRATRGSDIFIPLTRRKCRDARAWVMDIVKPVGGDKSWTLLPTPIPTLPPSLTEGVKAQLADQFAPYVMQDMMDYGQIRPETEQMLLGAYDKAYDQILQAQKGEAEKRAKRMEQKIEDKLVEGGFVSAFYEFLADLVEVKAGILKGPVYRRRKKQSGWSEANGSWQPVYTEEIVMEVDRVDPFRFFPGPNARSVQDSYTVEWHDMTAKQLMELIGVPGYSDEAIKAVLSEYSNGGGRWIASDVLQVYRDARGQNPSYLTQWDDRMDALEFNISIPGSHLMDWNVPNLAPERVYEVNAWLIGSHVIRCVLNPDPLGRNPYAVTSFLKKNGSVWGEGLPETIECDQDAVNMLGRAICNNAAFASLPQIAVDRARMAATGDNTMYPGKLWETEGGMGNEPPVKFWQPPVVVPALISAFETFMRQADSDSGVPAFAHGDSRVGGAGNTSSGLSMLVSMASRGIFSVVTGICTDVFTPLMTRFYDAVMMYDPDNAIKGDCSVNAAGVAAIMQREQAAVRLNEFAAQTANPIDMQIIGMRGRSEILRAQASRLDIPVDKVVPSQEAMIQAEQAAMAQAQAEANAQGANPEQPRELDAAGNPVSGQDTALTQGG